MSDETTETTPETPTTPEIPTIDRIKGSDGKYVMLRDVKAREMLEELLLAQPDDPEPTTPVETAQWHFGQAELAEDGTLAVEFAPLDEDVYLNLDTGALYQYTAGETGGTWSLLTTLTLKDSVDLSTLQLTDISWEGLASLSDRILADPSSCTGLIYQTKEIYITGYGNVPFGVVDVAHDVDADGNPLALTFMCDIVIDKKGMGTTTTGGYAASQMASWLESTLLPAFPGNVKSNIKTVRKAVGSTGHLDCKIWLLSEKEIFGTTDDGEAAEGTQYAYFAQNSDVAAKIKKDASGVAQPYWIRTTTTSGNFIYVAQTDAVLHGASSPNLECGVVPGFCM